MDERLRALERAARSSPGDRGAAWALVRALDQAGDARAAWLERCRLARAGDDLAWRELSPAPRGARRLAPGATRPFDMTHLGGARSAGDALLLVGDSTLHRLDARSLERTWSAATLGADPGAVCGAHVVHGPDDGATLFVRDVVTGAPLDRLQLPSGARARAVTGVADQVAVCCAWETDLPDGLVLLDLVAPRAERAVRRSALTPVVVRNLALEANVPLRGSTNARDLVSGDVRWTTPGSLLRADPRSALVLTFAGRSMQLASVDLTTGCITWTHLVAADHTASHALGPDLLVIATTAPPWSKVGRERLDVDAIERGTGEGRWSYEEEVGLHTVDAVALAHDVVYVLHGPVTEPGEERRRTLLALDARTGERLDVAPVPPTVSGLVTLHPVDGAVLVVARGRRSTWVGRFGED